MLKNVNSEYKLLTKLLNLLSIKCLLFKSKYLLLNYLTYHSNNSKTIYFDCIPYKVIFDNSVNIIFIVYLATMNSGTKILTLLPILENNTFSPRIYPGNLTILSG